MLYCVGRGDPVPSDPEKATEAARDVCKEHFPHIADLRLQLGGGQFRGQPCWTITYQTERGKIPKVAIRESDQEWLELPRLGDVSRAVGYWKTNAPIPPDLERPEVWHSMIFSLGVLDNFNDKSTWWKLPILPTDLPKSWSFQENKFKYQRELLVDLMPLCRKYYDIDNLGRKLLAEQESIEAQLAKPDLDDGVRTQRAERLKEIEAQATQLRLPDAERANDCLRILNLNYYITEIEAELLGLLTEETMLTILMRCTQDKGAIEAQLEAEKKG